MVGDSTTANKRPGCYPSSGHRRATSLCAIATSASWMKPCTIAWIIGARGKRSRRAIIASMPANEEQLHIRCLLDYRDELLNQLDRHEHSYNICTREPYPE